MYYEKRNLLGLHPPHMVCGQCLFKKEKKSWCSVYTRLESWLWLHSEILYPGCKTLEFCNLVFVILSRHNESLDAGVCVDLRPGSLWICPHTHYLRTQGVFKFFLSKEELYRECRGEEKCSQSSSKFGWKCNFSLSNANTCILFNIICATNTNIPLSNQSKKVNVEIAIFTW